MNEKQMPEKKGWGKMWLGLLIGALVVGIAWLLWYYLTPPKEVEVEKVVEKKVIREVEVPVEEEEETLTPVETVEAFYDWYFGPHSPVGISDLDFLKTGDYLADSFIAELEEMDNVTGAIICGNEEPDTRSYSEDQLYTRNASVFADHNYSGSGLKQIQVTLIKANGQWKIDGIICPQ